MININKYNIEYYKNNLINKKVHFKSDCVYFPNFDTICIINKIEKRQNSNEILFYVTIIKNGRNTIIGSGMNNLEFEILN